MTDPPSIKQPRKRRLLFLFAGLCVVGAAVASPSLRTWIACWQIRSLLDADDVTVAMQAAKQLAESRPNCGECQFLLAKAARRSGDFSEAGRALQAARAADWDPKKIQFEQVLATAQTGQVRSVERELKQIFDFSMTTVLIF